MKTKGIWLTAIVSGLILSVCGGCSGKADKEPVTLTIWHVYGDQTNSPLNDLIDEFNNTVGKEENIKLEVEVVSNTSKIHDAVLRAANHEPGAAKLPDIFISYPKTVLAMPDQEILVDYHDYFTEGELEAYIPEFVEEGEVNERLVVFPVAKSTEILFVDNTLFDRFAKDTGVSMEDLKTWESLFATAKKYYAWTDAQTPDIENDGKTFFVHDYWFNYFQVGCESLGADFFKGNDVNADETFQRVWEPFADAAIEGSVWLHEGFATDPLRTGDVVVSVASSASVLYYEDIVTYADNRSEPIEMVAMPVPTFQGGEKLVMQRGAGLCTVKSTPEREKAAVTFLKWLTEPQKNVEFVTTVGYMPVTKVAFEYLPEAVEGLENPKYKSLYNAFIETQKEYQLYTAPQKENYLELEMNFETNVRAILSGALEDYRHKGIGREKALNSAYQSLLDKTISSR